MLNIAPTWCRRRGVGFTNSRLRVGRLDRSSTNRAARNGVHQRIAEQQRDAEYAAQSIHAQVLSGIEQAVGDAHEQSVRIRDDIPRVPAFYATQIDAVAGE